MADMDGLIGRLRAGRDELVRLRPRISAAEPWPLSDVFGAEPEAQWGPPELLAHVEEMLPYWLGEMERIIEATAETGEPAPFGRVQTDALRIGLIGRDRTLPLRELYARISSDTDRLAARLAELTEDELGRRGTHPRHGEMEVREIADRHIVDHLERHIEQLEDILAARGA